MENTTRDPRRSFTADLPPYPRAGDHRVGSAAAVGPRSGLARGLVCLLGAALATAWVALGVVALIDIRHLDRFSDSLAAGLEGLLDVAAIATGVGGAACAVAATIAYVVRRRTVALWLFVASVLAPLFGVLVLVVLVAVPMR